MLSYKKHHLTYEDKNMRIQKRHLQWVIITILFSLAILLSAKLNKKSLPLYLYRENTCRVYAPSGWMGDYSDIRISQRWTKNPYSGKSCIRIRYSVKQMQKKGWAGIFWQYPRSNWGNLKGGFNLTGAKRIYFYARGKKGNEVIQVKMGGLSGTESKDSTTSIISFPIKLTKNWKRYSINLDGKNLSCIIGAFAVVFTKAFNPDGATIYLDDIFYSANVMEKVTQNILASKISTEVDPQYAVKYHSKFVPGKNKALLLIGQDKQTIKEYLKHQKVKPAGYMIYTSVQKMEGLHEPVDIGAGIMHAQYLADTYPGSVIQMGLYMVNALDGIIAGNYDANLTKLSAWVKKVKRPVYIRIGYEFDGKHNHYDPVKYVKAFRYIVDLMRKNKVKNAAYAWTTWGGWPYKGYSLKSWYPGDKYVDWFGLSIFSQPYHDFDKNKYVMNLLEMARKHKKPVMIGEATPFGGIHPGIASWNKWFAPVFSFIYRYNIKMFCYINSNWEKMPMWKNQGWGDCRIQKETKLQKLWLKEIRKNRWDFQ